MAGAATTSSRSEEHTSELQSPDHLVCRLLLEKKNDHAVELVLAHFLPQRPVAALIFLLAEMVVDRCPIIGRVVHVGERRFLVEARAHLFPWLVCGRIFFFNDTATTEIYTLSLHDALPICRTLTSNGDGSDHGWGSHHFV